MTIFILQTAADMVKSANLLIFDHRSVKNSGDLIERIDKIHILAAKTDLCGKFDRLFSRYFCFDLMFGKGAHLLLYFCRRFGSVTNSQKVLRSRLRHSTQMKNTPKKAKLRKGTVVPESLSQRKV